MKKCIVIELLYYLERQSTARILGIGLFSTIVIGTLDILSGDTFSLALFYLIPIGFFAWFLSLNIALMNTLACTIVWSASNQVMGIAPLISNIVTNLGFYTIFSIMIHYSRIMYEHEKVLSRTDHLTGLLNNRSFYEVAQNYLCIMKRRKSPFSIAFIDLDNFKEINDQYGHDAGDEALKDFAESIVSTLRVTDKAARFGGDEFVVMFPDTDSASIDIIMKKINERVKARMSAYNYNLSFSAGVICCSESVHTIDELVKMADKLMYDVKSNGKNSFVYRQM
jgi:diguanylate cyclase (GGDEF)-like protein